ncbi:MAG: hypothetical protein ABJQ43_16335, partial [Anderseniella sp.]
MTGLIAGLISLTGRNADGAADKLAAALRANASCTEPDIHCDDEAVLLQCELRAPGAEPCALRPMVSDPQIGILASDHRLYNHRELAEDLGLGRDSEMSDVLAGALASCSDRARGLA